ncbi:hypothetical protein C5F52_28325 [Limnohabitans sp. TS-CS-82]|jgi:hypothetical protein|uniref:hypothetical protein n=1 Tax=Limnohabitans sp. TS-CS-82 TaxID=2094193 RepID=UPI000CF22784|nr:hypothetical protein [Limnohabitans sp. TS-CS-82]PQA79793.1 hypothetical protein C5F52_28325 [Limnohabitans sp. TS-CS-82]
MINHTMVLTINGTRRSEKAGGLDDGEVSTFENKPGEYREDLSTVEDLIENINHSAYMRGEWISSMKLDGRDIVEEHAIKILQENMLNIGESAVELSQAGMFAAADLEDLITFLQSIKAKHFDDNLEDDHE